MANTTFNIPRAHIVMALCLPLAVLLGYVLAEPFESGSMAVIVFVLVILSVPIFMKWHHPLLVISWNAVVNPLFFPGRAGIWLAFSAISLFFAVLGRATDPDQKFISVPSITRPIIFLSLVVVGTGFLTGGFGSRFLGSSHYGGGRYVSILGSLAGYFALTSRRIPPNRAPLYSGFFFLSGLTAIISNLAFMAGPGFYFLYYFFSPGLAQDQALASMGVDHEMVRFGSFTLVAPAIYLWLFARYGIRGMLDLGKPWRLGLLIATVIASMFGGFRSSLILFLMTATFLFFLEGLHRTRHLLVAICAILMIGVTVVTFGNKLPLTIQRTLAFLPAINLDQTARMNAEASSEWRLEMWKAALPDVPKYLVRGKGYALDPRDIEDTGGAFNRSLHNQSWSVALLMGDYHNGPLSVIIPFGIFGAAAFLWLLIASIRQLWQNLKHGGAELRQTNALILASFLAHTVIFFFVFGSLHSDLPIFMGLLGLSVALNGEVVSTVATEDSEASEMNPLFKHGLPAPFKS